MKISFNPCVTLIGVLTAASPLVFAQQPDVTELPAVTVVAQTPAQQSRRELEAEQALTPGGVSVIDGAQLSQRNLANTADMLRYVPGVWAASGAGTDATFISMRGSNLDAVDYDGSGVKLLQDGLPVTAADGNNHNRFVDPLSARHVVVARGSNALTYGASTLGGAIDFISPTALDSAPAELFFSAGSFGQQQLRLGASGVGGQSDGLINVETKRRDGYRQHNRQEREGLYANAGWLLSDAMRTRLFVSYVSNAEELPGRLTRAQFRADPAQAEADAVSGHYQWNVESWRLANTTTWDISRSSSLTLGWSYEEQQLYHPIVQKPFFSLLIDTEQRNLGTSLRYRLHLPQHDVVAGLGYGRTEVGGGNYGNNAGQRTALMTRVDNDADTTELFIMDRWQFARGWTVVYGAQGLSARREIRNTTVATGSLRNPQADYGSINPRAGLIYQVKPGTELFANISRVYEAPTTYQLEDQVGGDEQTLKAMHGTSFELGSRGRQTTGSSQWHWDVALYYARINDEIISVNNPRADGTSISGNVDNTVHAGVEALLGASFRLDEAATHNIEPLLNLTLNHFRFANDAIYGDKRLPAAPAYAVRGELLYRNSNGLFAGPTCDVVGKRYADFSNSYLVDAYALWGLRAGLKRKGWEAFGELRNLANKDYIATHSVRAKVADDAAVLSSGEPRSVYMGAKFQF